MREGDRVKEGGRVEGREGGWMRRKEMGGSWQEIRKQGRKLGRNE